MKKVIYSTAVVGLLLGGGELFARFVLGLGDPPISISDSEVDYLFAPNQNCNRFGNAIIYNNYSMRTGFDITNDERKRIFVVGDSVVNGGALTDHNRLATTLLQNELGDDYAVCNVSAGSWGIGNYVAYFNKNCELLDGGGGVLFLEINSHDLWEDDPKMTAGANVGNDVFLIDRKPACALWEGLNRYLLPRIRRYFKVAKINNKVDVVHWEEDAYNKSAQYNLRMLDKIFSMPFEKKFLVIHRTRQETESGAVSVGEKAFRDSAQSYDVPILLLELDPASDYRDVIHLNDNGQHKLYKLLRAHLD